MIKKTAQRERMVELLHAEYAHAYSTNAACIFIVLVVILVIGACVKRLSII